jgi:hypothetical protein
MPHYMVKRHPHLRHTVLHNTTITVHPLKPINIMNLNHLTTMPQLCLAQPTTTCPALVVTSKNKNK